MKQISYLKTILSAFFIGLVINVVVDQIKNGNSGILPIINQFKKGTLFSVQNHPVDKPIVDITEPLLPTEISVIVGERLNLYYDGLILAYEPDNYKVQFESKTLNGTSERRLWWIEPKPSEVGRHQIKVQVKDYKDKLIAEAETSINVIAPPKPKNIINILIVGASNTHQNVMPNSLWKKLNLWGPGKFNFVGSTPIRSELKFYVSALPQVLHEGYGGWTWDKFLTHYLPGQEKIHYIPKSPFVFLEKGKPKLDVGRYLDEKGVKGKLDAVIFDLGVNETFGANPDDPKNIDSIIDSALNSADTLIAAFQKDAPETKIIIAIPAPFTRSKPVFMRRYGEINPEFGDPWRFRRIIQALAKKMIEHFSDKRVVLSPLYATLDVIDGYGAVDPGHPNEFGGDQMATTIQASLISALYSDDKKLKTVEQGK